MMWAGALLIILAAGCAPAARDNSDCSFAVLYGLVAQGVARRVTKMFGDNIVALSVAVLFASVGLAVVGGLFGDF